MTNRPVTKGIWEGWLDYEQRTGNAVRFYRAYPEIGRGGVEHDLPSHQQVEEEFLRVLKPSIWRRVRNFLMERV